MHYVRFLKPPIFHMRGSQVSVKALVTVATDLGEDFFPADLKLEAALIGQLDRESEWRTIVWKPGMRAAWVEITDVPSAFLKDTASLLVNFRRSIEADKICMKHVPDVLGARSRINGLHEASYISRLERKLRTTSTELCIWEDVGESIARHIWDAAIALIAYIDEVALTEGEKIDSPKSALSPLPSLLKAAPKSGLRILELGSGCGVVGTWMATTFPNSHVIMTDLPEATEILGLNIVHAKAAAGSRLEKGVLDWNGTVPEDITEKTFDLIVVSDCTYNCDSLPALVKTLAALVFQSPQALIVVSMKVRHESELVFFDLMSEAGLKMFEQVYVPLSSTDQLPLGQPRETAEVYIFGARKDTS